MPRAPEREPRATGATIPIRPASMKTAPIRVRTRRRFAERGRDGAGGTAWFFVIQRDASAKWKDQLPALSTFKSQYYDAVQLAQVERFVDKSECTAVVCLFLHLHERTPGGEDNGGSITKRPHVLEK